MKKAEGTIYHGPMIDSHSHYRETIQPEMLPTAIKEAGLEKIILFVLPPFLTQASKIDPDHIIPFIRVGKTPFALEALIDTVAVNEIQQALESGKAKGIGELCLRHRRFSESLTDNTNPTDHPLLLEIYDLAVKYGVLVIVHVEHEYSEELERALTYNRNARIIWAHYGDAPPQFVRTMLIRHPNLYADLSAINPIPGYRHPELASADPEGNIKPDWKDLFLELSDRFMFGIDMGGETRVRNAPEVVKYYRKVLGQLPTSVAKKIAHDNILSLLGQNI